MNESMYDICMLKYFKLNKHIKEKKKEPQQFAFKFFQVYLTVLFYFPIDDGRKYIAQWHEGNNGV